MKYNIARWLSLGMKRVASSEIERNGSGRKRRRNRFHVELLERRQVLSMITWAASGGGDWDTATNWSPQQVPGSGDEAIINLSSAGTVSLSSNNSDMLYNVVTNSKTTLAIENGSLTLVQARVQAPPRSVGRSPWMRELR